MVAQFTDREQHFGEECIHYEMFFHMRTAQLFFIKHTASDEDALKFNLGV